MGLMSFLSYFKKRQCVDGKVGVRNYLNKQIIDIVYKFGLFGIHK